MGSTSYTEEISNEASSSQEFSISVGGHENGYLWQFVFYGIGKDEVKLAETKTRDYSITASASEYPCCYPGHCLDTAFSHATNVPKGTSCQNIQTQSDVA